MNHNNYIGKTLRQLADDIPEYAKGFYTIMPTKQYSNMSLNDVLELSTVINMDHYLDAKIELISDTSIDSSYWIVIN